MDMSTKPEKSGDVDGMKGKWKCSEVTQDDVNNVDFACCSKYLPTKDEETESDTRITTGMEVTVV